MIMAKIAVSVLNSPLDINRADRFGKIGGAFFTLSLFWILLSLEFFSKVPIYWVFLTTGLLFCIGVFCVALQIFLRLKK